MFSLSGNQEKCKLNPVFSVRHEKEYCVLREWILRKNQQIALLMANMTREKNTYSALILFAGSFWLPLLPQFFFPINSSETDSKGDIIKACQKTMCTAVLKGSRGLQHP